MYFGSSSSNFIFAHMRSVAIAAVLLVMGTGFVMGQAFTENFDTVPVSGWTTQNNSVAGGASNWFQGNTLIFTSHAGAANAYIGANFNNTIGNNTISNWLVTPQRNLSNGDVIRFWTRRTTSPFPDRLQVRLSLAGSSTNVGTTTTSVGDFTTMLYEINPTYNNATGAPPANYPQVWTEITITLSGIPAGASGRFAFRYFVENGGPEGTQSDYIGIDTFSYTPAAAPVQHVVDFNGDGKTDYAITRNVGGGASGQLRWFVNPSGTSGFYPVDWGLASDRIVPVDYDGDNKSDIAIWRPAAAGSAAFYILNSSNGAVRIETFGQTGDDPSIVDDYDGDNKADLAVYRAGASAGQQSIWYYRGSLNNPSGGTTFVPWGSNGDVPAPGDYDGDGKADYVIKRNSGGPQSVFWSLRTTAGIGVVAYGVPSDACVPGDYDGDGKTDIAVVRDAGGVLSWYFIPSSTGVPSAAPAAVFGLSTDSSAQGDYDGDGKTDFAVWRSSAVPGGSNFWVLGSTSGVTAQAFGQSGDSPVANYNRH